MKAEIIVTPEEVEVVSIVQRVVNEVDDPSEFSKTTITVLPESVDKVAKTDKEEEETTVISKTEKKEEEPTKEETSEETLPLKVKDKPKEKDAVQKRIDELTKKRREAERERDWERTKRLELETELKAAKSVIPQTGKPKQEDFETDLDYLEAVSDWKIEQKFKAESEKVSKEMATVDEKAVIDEIYRELDKNMEKGRKKYPDFIELVLNKDVKISEAMIETLLFSDTAEDVLYYLGKHPDESVDIAELPPLKAAHELGKIVARLNAPPPRKKITNAPEPITPVKTTGITEQDPSNMTPREYRAWREKQK